MQLAELEPNLEAHKSIATHPVDCIKRDGQRGVNERAARAFQRQKQNYSRLQGQKPAHGPQLLRRQIVECEHVVTESGKLDDLRGQYRSARLPSLEQNK